MFDDVIRLPKIDIGKIREEKERREEKAWSKQKAKSKPLDQLVYTIQCKVENVFSNTQATQHTPHSEIRIGGRSPIYETGYQVQIQLNVVPFNTQIPIKNIVFLGSSGVRGGDIIQARIPCYEPKERTRPDGDQELIYLPRPFKKEESAIEIAILNRGKIIRVDRAIDYLSFMEQ